MIIFVLLGIICAIFLISLNTKTARLRREYKRYLNAIEGIHEYTPEYIQNGLTEWGDSFQFSNEEIPYGRAKWFVISKKLSKNIDDLNFFGYSPTRSHDNEEFQEFGFLLSQEGIYTSVQNNEGTKVDKKIVYSSESNFYPFSGLWKVVVENSQIILYYPDFKPRVLPMTGSSIVHNLNWMIKSGYTNDIYSKFIEKKIQEDLSIHENPDVLSKNFTQSISGLAAVNANTTRHFGKDNVGLKGIVNNPQGHGLAAEYANNLVDQVMHPFQHVKRIGQDNAKNGADRIVGHTQIQTKYYATSTRTVSSAFDHQTGLYKYEGMQLEVPRDQYSGAIQKMQQKIQEGKVPGHHNPADANQLIRKGHITYQESRLIAQGGNITSLKFDLADGAVQSLSVGGISFAIVFAQAKWSGAGNKEAAILAAKQGVITIAKGAVVYAGTQQISKVLFSQYGIKTSEQFLKGSAMTLSFAIVMGPSLFDAVSGRISSQQLLKNGVVAGGGFLAGTMAGAAFGPLGAIAGGIVGTIATKKVMDQFIQDDRIEMFAQLKEEYIDVVMSMSLVDNEFNEIQLLIFDEKLESKLKDMFKNKSIGSRKYARENIIEEATQQIISRRKVVSEEDIIESVEFAKNEFVAVV